MVQKNVFKLTFLAPKLIRSFVDRRRRWLHVSNLLEKSSKFVPTENLIFYCRFENTKIARRPWRLLRSLIDENNDNKSFFTTSYRRRRLQRGVFSAFALLLSGKWLGHIGNTFTSTTNAKFKVQKRHFVWH